MNEASELVLLLRLKKGFKSAESDVSYDAKRFSCSRMQAQQTELQDASDIAFVRE